MPGELDAEHVEHLALQPVGGEVYVHAGFGLKLSAIFVFTRRRSLRPKL